MIAIDKAAVAEYADLSKIDILAHQGWQSGRTPSNSLNALSNAFGCATSAELDVYVMATAEGKQEIVILHPEAYFLYADSKGMKNEQPIPMSFEDLRAVKVNGQQLVPTLDEVLDSYHEQCTASGFWTDLHIELKGPSCVEAVVEKLHQRIQAGQLSYDNFMLTGLSYATDAEPARIEQARNLDPNFRLVMVLRGDNLPAEGFQDWNAVIEKAKELDVEVITLARKFATPQLIEFIRSEGFTPGVYHARTSDELENVIELGAKLIAADMYHGPNLNSYPHVREQGSAFFKALHRMEWFHTRDWIWENAWDLEKKILTQELPQATVPASTNAEAVLIQDDKTVVCRTFARANGGMSQDVDLSNVQVDPKFLNKLDNAYGSLREAENFSVASLISKETLFQDFVDLCYGIAKQHECLDQNYREVIEKLSFDVINKLNTSQEVEELSDVPGQQFVIAIEAAYQTAWRAGRLVGMLAFSALNPRHQEGNDFLCEVKTVATSELGLARTACEEQISAQALRSGKRVAVNF